jgi:hypothetical protein
MAIRNLQQKIVRRIMMLVIIRRCVVGTLRFAHPTTNDNAHGRQVAAPTFLVVFALKNRHIESKKSL